MYLIEIDDFNEANIVRYKQQKYKVSNTDIIQYHPIYRYCNNTERVLYLRTDWIKTDKSSDIIKTKFGVWFIDIRVNMLKTVYQQYVNRSHVSIKPDDDYTLTVKTQARGTKVIKYNISRKYPKKEIINLGKETDIKKFNRIVQNKEVRLIITPATISINSENKVKFFVLLMEVKYPNQIIEDIGKPVEECSDEQIEINM